MSSKAENCDYFYITDLMGREKLYLNTVLEKVVYLSLSSDLNGFSK